MLYVYNTKGDVALTKCFMFLPVQYPNQKLFASSVFLACS